MVHAIQGDISVSPRQIPAKMRLESQCLCGFPKGTVEMEEARLGRWHFFPPAHLGYFSVFVEMEEARLGRWHNLDQRLILVLERGRNGRSPFRALTHLFEYNMLSSISAVEMEEARLGRWHPREGAHSADMLSHRRNGRSPFRALTPISGSVVVVVKFL